MFKAKRIVPLFILLLTIISCKKPGLGGGNIVVAFPLHHGKPIYGDTLFIKFNATELPGVNVNDYDMRVVGDSAEEHCHINGLKSGKYYLFAVGWDPSISQRVKGGLAITLTKREGETEVYIPVTE